MKTIRILLVLVAVISITLSLKSQKWIVQHSGLPASLNPTLIFSAVDSNICWGINYFLVNPKLVLTTDGGDNWNLIELPEFFGYESTSISAIDENTAWVALDDATGGASTGIFKTTNSGMDWEQQTTAFPIVGGHAREVHFFDADNGLCVGTPRNGNWEIYTTQDGGENWIQVPSANIPPPASSSDFPLPSVKAVSGDCYWFTTFSRSIYRSTDRGLTWEATSNIHGQSYSGVLVAFKDNMIGLGASYFGPKINSISASSDGGASWSLLPAPPSRPSASYLVYVPGTAGAYVLTSHNNIGGAEPTVAGSTYTDDGGQTWQQIDSLAHGPVSFAGNSGWSAGRGDTIFKWKWTTWGIEDDFAFNKPNAGIDLSQNYPNPFSGSTLILFKIPSTDHVILKVYDILGTEVATLVNEAKSAGTYRVNFEPGELGSGIYFYRLQVGKSVQAKKLFVL